MVRQGNVFAFVFSMIKRRGIKEVVLKNVEILLGYPLYFFSFLCIRNNNKWVIGSENGFVGNCKFFLLDDSIKNSEKSIYWISLSRKDVKKVRNIFPQAYYKWSLKGIYHSLTAKVYIYSHYTIDINFWTSGGAKKVNLWHGVGIKNIEFKTHVGNAGKIYREKNILARIYMPHLFKRPDLMLSTSPMMTKHFSECFRITEQICVEDMYPRCKPFFWKREKLKEFIYKNESFAVRELYEKMLKYNQIYLYMPTWREDRSDFIKISGIDFEVLNSSLRKKQALFLLKLHPATNLNVDISKYSNVLMVDKNIDIYPLLPVTDILITDYSSIYYDYILMKEKHILLFPFDYSDYISKDRDLAFDFDKYTPGVRAYTFRELLDYIENQIPIINDDKEWIINQFWGNVLTLDNKNILLERINLLT
ncbi:CDP-glycerol glycerophosphotransferase family protein [Odoribacter lunatus]|uniref:CDP-glycerol glycerophosphotransferase family protein n=1 Tax=Odoribacter lunatus TaxID=2941335 RepID=UPI00203FF7A1|nr:CDP-glycerol glycerophosphotransferase family protein [Odoribacter lunatus]